MFKGFEIKVFEKHRGKKYRRSEKKTKKQKRNLNLFARSAKKKIEVQQKNPFGTMVPRLHINVALFL